MKLFLVMVLLVSLLRYHSHERMESQLRPKVRQKLSLHAAKADGIFVQNFHFIPRAVQLIADS